MDPDREKLFAVIDERKNGFLRKELANIMKGELSIQYADIFRGLVLIAMKQQTTTSRSMQNLIVMSRKFRDSLVGIFLERIAKGPRVPLQNELCEDSCTLVQVEQPVSMDTGLPQRLTMSLQLCG